MLHASNNNPSYRHTSDKEQLKLKAKQDPETSSFMASEIPLLYPPIQLTWFMMLRSVSWHHPFGSLHSQQDAREAGVRAGCNLQSMFYIFLQISIVLFHSISRVMQEGLLFWQHGLWFMLEAGQLSLWRRVSSSCLIAVMNAVAEVDYETWKDFKKVLLVYYIEALFRLLVKKKSKTKRQDMLEISPAII